MNGQSLPAARLEHTTPDAPRRTALSTGIPRLDEALLSSDPEPYHDTERAITDFTCQGWSRGEPGYEGNEDTEPGGDGSSHLELTPGVQRGVITEISGPRGSGKTALAMTAAADALRRGESVVWIDTAGPLCATRLQKILSTGNQLDNLLHLQPTTLAHLMAIISFPVPNFPPPTTSLIVLDSISCLFKAEFQSRLNIHMRKSANWTRDEEVKESQESKLRWNLIGNLAGNLRSLASRLNCAVIAINELGTRFRPGKTPMLHPAVSGYTWGDSVAARVVLYWHWLSPGLGEKVGLKRVRIAEVLKTWYKPVVPREARRIVPFLVCDAGVEEFTRLTVRLSDFIEDEDVPLPVKRKVEQQLSPAQLPRRPKVGHGGDQGGDVTEKDPVQPAVATTYIYEVMDSQDEEEDEVWLDTTLAADVATPPPEAARTDDDDTELLLRSMLE